ncbi:MAG: phosphoglucosamine mutase [Flavobacteriaceae bacterium]|nr:phosphoglucosamine mutase [Flavobacteriaceae bacterium]
MTLIKSISGIRGTIGGRIGEGLSPMDIVKFTSGYGDWIKTRSVRNQPKIVVGRDARISGEMVKQTIIGTLLSLGIDVIDLGLATTPTVEIAVPEENADGGIIITASHNPGNWNALKLLHDKGEFLSDKEGKEVVDIAEKGQFVYATVDKLGSLKQDNTYNAKHIEKILNLSLVDQKSIQLADFKVVIDCVNSVGGVILPKLLKALGVKKIIELYCTPNGKFPHNPEPLPENLNDISNAVKKNNADIGFVVDPDVDRLAIVNEDGTMFGEEYTLVAVADYILQNNCGNTVSNLSSTRVLRDVTEKYGGTYFASAVGEVNVVQTMKEKKAKIGGEGNGGVIYPEIHYGRDALVGIALFLSFLAKSGKTCSGLRGLYPNYFISKNKIQIEPERDIDKLLLLIKDKYKHAQLTDIDGIKIEFEQEWVHLRKSNTEPIIRIYAEAPTKEKAEKLANEVITEINQLMKIE